jgi:hypothetical protein
MLQLDRFGDIVECQKILYLDAIGFEFGHHTAQGVSIRALPHRFGSLSQLSEKGVEVGLHEELQVYIAQRATNKLGYFWYLIFALIGCPGKLTTLL